MHLCYLCNEYPPNRHGGIGTVMQVLSRAMAARGHCVSVVGVYPDGDGATVEEGVTVHRLPASRIRGTGFVLNGHRIRRALRAIDAACPIDLVEAPENGLALLPSQTRWRRAIRMHGGHHFFAVTLGRRPALWRSWVEKRSFRQCDQICAVSRFVASETARLLDLPLPDIEILPNPVDVERFRPMPEVTETEGLVTFVGTVCEKKGIRQLLAAMPLILDRVPGARLKVIGRDSRDLGTGGSYIATLRESLPTSVLERVEFVGPVLNDDLPLHLAAAQVLAYPSHMEAMPVAWLEGIAMGKPVLASRTGPGPEVVEDGISGILCDPHDPSSIADGLVRLLRNQHLRAELGAAARERALTRFSLEMLAPMNEAYYATCRNASRSAKTK